MLLAAWILAFLTIALAWPVPILLARAAWPSRSPALALALWQAVALSGGLSMIGAMLIWGLIPFGPTLQTSVEALVRSIVQGTLPPNVTFIHIFALCGAFFLGAHLLLNLALTFVRAERQRRRHHNLVELLSEPLQGRPGTRVLDHAAPVAYCLPGALRSITVLSGGLLTLLEPDELRAVIAHEKAHLSQQHHTVLLAFKSWHSALPWFPIANRAENAVALLVEMLADDQALRVVDERTLARAIALVGTAGESGGIADSPRAEATDPAHVTEAEHPFDLVMPRVQRLLTPPNPLPVIAQATVVLSAISLLALPTALLLRV